MSVSFRAGISLDLSNGISLDLSNGGAAIVLGALDIALENNSHPGLDPMMLRGRIDLFLLQHHTERADLISDLEARGLTLAVFGQLRDIATQAEQLGVLVSIS